MYLGTATWKHPDYFEAFGMLSLAMGLASLISVPLIMYGKRFRAWSAGSLYAPVIQEVSKPV